MFLVPVSTCSSSESRTGETRGAATEEGLEFAGKQRKIRCVGVCPFSGLWRGFYGWWVFRTVSKIALGNMVWLSFNWLLAVNSA